MLLVGAARRETAVVELVMKPAASDGDVMGAGCAHRDGAAVPAGRAVSETTGGVASPPVA
jgi:hypothetical protein